MPPPADPAPPAAALGVVVIGRNEGKRLVRCLDAVPAGVPVVYVDSGSTDGSVTHCRDRRVEVVELDLSTPFTAARARNAGAARLAERHPGVGAIQFVDGDCELAPGWLNRARAELVARPDAAVVCGRLRERHPEASVYNRLCDLEWDTPTGDVAASGGIAVMRAAAFAAAGGFRADLIAGEEPELCARLRAAGGRVVRLPDEMALHDAAMTRFDQWWRRSVRTGYGYAALAATGTAGLEPGAVRSNWVWGLGLPAVATLAAVAAGVAAGWWAALGVLVAAVGLYLLQVARVYRHRRRYGDPPAAARLYAGFCVLSKFPQAVGQVRHARDRRLARPGRLIEYKGVGRDRPRVAYLVNQYPHPRHTFIRREILALEGLGWEVVRVTARRAAVALPDPTDQAELARTHALLDAGLPRLAAGAVAHAVRHPVRWLRAARVAVRLARRSGRWLRQPVYLAQAAALANRLRRAGVHHLHVHFGTNPADVALLCHTLGGPPFSFTVHGSEEFDRPEALSLGDKIAAAAFVVTVSAFSRSQLYRWGRLIDWPKIRLVRCGLDVAFLDAGPLPPAAGRRVVCVGALAEQKGQLVLVAAAAKLAAHPDFRLVLAGDGPMRPEVEAAIARHGLQDRVEITGWVASDRVRAEIAAARVLVAPSLMENLPVVLMEALALGRPAVATWVAGIPELVRDGVNGWLVPAGDPDALAAALDHALATDDDRLAEMGRAGSAAVRAAHDARTEAAKLADLFAAANKSAAGGRA